MKFTPAIVAIIASTLLLLDPANAEPGSLRKKQQHRQRSLTLQLSSSCAGNCGVSNVYNLGTRTWCACVEGFEGDIGFCGDYAELCLPPPTDPPTVAPTSSPVNCGGHEADSCGNCPFDELGAYHGANSCNGECVWDIGTCRDKTSNDVDCGFYRHNGEERDGFYRPTCEACVSPESNAAHVLYCGGDCQEVLSDEGTTSCERKA